MFYSKVSGCIEDEEVSADTIFEILRNKRIIRYKTTVFNYGKFEV